MPPSEQPFLNGLAPHLKSALQVALRDLKSNEEVAAVDVGYLYDGEERTDSVGLRVHLRQGPTDRRALPLGVGRRPYTTSHGIVVQNFEAEYQRSAGPAHGTASRTDYHDPVRPGIGVCNTQRASGTLGLLVRRNEQVLMLSAYHVLSPAVLGQSPEVAQPSAPQIVGKFVGGFDDRTGDAALATIEGRKVNPAQHTSEVVVSSLAYPTLGALVSKSGAGSDVSYGIVDGIGRYFLPGTPQGMDGFRIVPSVRGRILSRNGDSGAVWYDSGTGTGYGLHVAGGTGGPVPSSVACFLASVLERLDVTPAH